MTSSPGSAIPYAVSIIVRTPSGIPLVRDPRKPAPRYWKFPGGRSVAGEEPAQTAVRELFEEIGLKLKPEELQLIHQEERIADGQKHGFFAYEARLFETPSLRPEGADGEHVEIFGIEKIRRMPDLFPSHQPLARLAGLL